MNDQLREQANASDLELAEQLDEARAELKRERSSRQDWAAEALRLDIQTDRADEALLLELDHISAYALTHTAAEVVTTIRARIAQLRGAGDG